MWAKHERAIMAREETKGERLMKKVCVPMLAVIIVVGWGLAFASGPPKLDPALTPYKPVSGVSGNVSSIGSGTLNKLTTPLGGAVKKIYPHPKIPIGGEGAATAPPAAVSC